MGQLPWRDRLKLLLGTALLKLGKLKYDKFTAEELSEYVREAFPRSLPVSIPVGDAELTLQRGEISLPTDRNELQIQTLAALKITWMTTTLYRAHLVITVSATPRYHKENGAVEVDDVLISNIQLINDEYALLKNTQELINRLVPGGFNELFRRPLENALNVISGGASERTLNYLNLYLSGNMQRILDFHRPQIQQALEQQLDNLDTSYALDHSHWRERLFLQYGKSVQVDEGELRFWF